MLTLLFFFVSSTLARTFHSFKGEHGHFTVNSNICGTGVSSDREASGYIHIPYVTDDKLKNVFNYDSLDMWFWHFPARYNASTAPLALIFGGGESGVPATERVFGVTGPCTFNSKDNTETTEPTANPLSYNQGVNMLYVDSPSPVGLSRGQFPGDTTIQSQPYNWELLQRILEIFPEYEGREVGIWDFDLGAHHAMSLALYIQQQNALIKDGSLNATTINLTSIGLISPQLDLPTQHRAAIIFAKKNKFHTLLNGPNYEFLLDEYDTKYADQFKACAANRLQYCHDEQRDYEKIFHNLTVGFPRNPNIPYIPTEAGNQKEGEGWGLFEVQGQGRPSYDPWDVRHTRKEMLRILPQIPSKGATATEKFLNRKSLRERLGGPWAELEAYSSLDELVYERMRDGQEGMRSSLKLLEKVVQTGLRTLIIGGEADLMNSPPAMGTMLENLNWPESSKWKKSAPKTFSLVTGSPMDPPLYEDDPRATEAMGEIKAAGNLTWMLFYNIGHDPETQDARMMRVVFERHMAGEALY